MSKTVSGHDAIKSWGSPLLAARRVPGTKVSLRTRVMAWPSLAGAAAVVAIVVALVPRFTQ